MTYLFNSQSTNSLNRELKNKVTGIDLMVPDFVEKVGKLSRSAVYNVIVITRLFYYKSKGLKESDVVQFTVSITIVENLSSSKEF